MRAPPDSENVGRSALDDSSSDSDDDGAKRKMQGDLPGAFPGSSTTASNNDHYY